MFFRWWLPNSLRSRQEKFQTIPYMVGEQWHIRASRAYEHDANNVGRPRPNQLQRIETVPSRQIAKLLFGRYSWLRSTGANGHPTHDLFGSKRGGTPHHMIISSRAINYLVHVYIMRYQRGMKSKLEILSLQDKAIYLSAPRQGWGLEAKQSSVCAKENEHMTWTGPE